MANDVKILPEIEPQPVPVEVTNTAPIEVEISDADEPIDVNIVDQPIDVSIVDQPIEVEATNLINKIPTVIVTILGFNPRHTIGVHQPIWDYNNSYQFLTSAQQLSISSDNTNDTLLGSGARTLRITGLDGSYAQIEEVINLNGTSVVNTSATFLRINRIVVDSVGAASANQGNITIQGTSVQGYIITGQNRARSAIYTIPAGYVGRLKVAKVSIGNSSNAGGIKQAHIDLFVTDFGKPTRISNLGFLNSEADSSNGIVWESFREFAEKTDIVLMCHTHFENVATSSFMEIWLEPNA